MRKPTISPGAGVTDRTYTILYGPGEALDDAIAAAGIHPAPGDEIIALWSKCDDIPAESRLVSVVRDGNTYTRCLMAESDTIH